MFRTVSFQKLLLGQRKVSVCGHQTRLEARPARARSDIRLSCIQPSHDVTSRRLFLTRVISSIFLTSTLVPREVNAVPSRTILDEERELSEKVKKEEEVTRKEALRAAFDAVQKARGQLDDLQVLIEEENWGGVRQFTRLFNDSVEREGMESIASKLTEKPNRKAAFDVARSLTSTLIQIDRCAMRKDKAEAMRCLDEAREKVSRFDSFKP